MSGEILRTPWAISADSPASDAGHEGHRDFTRDFPTVQWGCHLNLDDIAFDPADPISTVFGVSADYPEPSDALVRVQRKPLSDGLPLPSNSRPGFHPSNLKVLA